jgi:hypothetical protein
LKVAIKIPSVGETMTKASLGKSQSPSMFREERDIGAAKSEGRPRHPPEAEVPGRRHAASIQRIRLEDIQIKDARLQVRLNAGIFELKASLREMSTTLRIRTRGLEGAISSRWSLLEAESRPARDFVACVPEPPGDWQGCDDVSPGKQPEALHVRTPAMAWRKVQRPLTSYGENDACLPNQALRLPA